MELTYSYLPCEFCVGKNHCAQCGETIQKALIAMNGVRRAEVDGLAKKLSIDCEDLDDIADNAEALGVFF
ncbi:MAG: heavy-metal-associated domain-containing protein [Clostridia bacterium]|nr:heavy-metal-associated domain-containing protein [Clostridia bacterium]